MRFVLPQFATPLPRSFEVRGQRRLGVGLVSGWRLDGSVLHVADLWREVAEELPADVLLDQGIPKSRGELIVTAVAHSSEPTDALHVRVQVGPVDKTLYVVGDRQWAEGVPSAPTPFESMPLGWERAFGGEGYAANPSGRGVDGVQLPNVERPGALVSSPSDRPEPAGYGPIELTRASRMKHIGTYDADWLRTRYPGFADDTDWRFFQLAPEDQWTDAMWRGDESVAFDNLHPSRPRVEGHLPGVRARMFVRYRGREGLVEVALRLTTVWLFPHRELVVLVHHGHAETTEADGSDVELLLGALEGLDAPRSEEHYADVVRRRLDPEWGPLHALHDEDLMPEGLALPALGEGAEPPLRGGRLEDNLKRRATEAHERLRATLREAGVEPREELEAPAPTQDTDLQSLPQQIEALRDKAQQERAQSMARVKQVVEGLGRTPLGDQTPTGGPPPLVGALLRQQLERLVAQGRREGRSTEALEQQLADPDFQRTLTMHDAAAREGYRRTAHQRAAAVERDEDEAQRLRAFVSAAAAEGGSLAGHDLTGADLSHLDLRRVSLAGAWLELANLQCADLRGVDLCGAVLTRADLSDAKLDGAALRGANLGHARLLYASAAAADLSDAILLEADLRAAQLSSANLRGAELSGARFDQTDLSGAGAAKLMLLKGSLAGAILARADLSGANLLEVDLRGVDFTGASLVGAVLYACEGEGAVFRGASLSNLRVVGGCTFDQADFRGAVLERANLRGTSLLGAAFDGAILDDADLSEVRAGEASFYRATAKRARFVKADLSGARLVSLNAMEALFTEACLNGADLRGSNLFAADLWDAQGDEAMSLEGALTTRARFRRELTA